jgi:hypothetical protein
MAMAGFAFKSRDSLLAKVHLLGWYAGASRGLLVVPPLGGIAPDIHYLGLPPAIPPKGGTTNGASNRNRLYNQSRFTNRDLHPWYASAKN